MWAVRLAGVRARRGRPAALVLHAEPPGHDRVQLQLAPGVELTDLSELPRLDDAQGNLAPFISLYREVVQRLADRHAAPVVLSPNLHGDCYGIAAAICTTEPETVRVVGWQHSPIDYNYRMLARYEPILSRFVAVSNRIEEDLRRRLPHRARDIVNIPYGVPVPSEPPRREPVAGRPVRLIYTGRIEHKEKRILALAHLAGELAGRGVDHELVAIGDGPAVDEFDEAIAGIPTVRRLPASPPTEINRWLDRSDALVLPSRYEGLSVSMLEAMARGCVPIVTRVASGVDQAIEEGVNGELVDVGPDDDEPAVAGAVADAIERYLGGAPQRYAERAWRTAREHFSLERHADAVEAMLEEVVREPAQAWPADRACAFSSADPAGGSGSVPPDGARRLTSLLQGLAGRRIVVHGTGQHTRQLAHVLARSPAEIVAFTDHDRQQHRSRLWNWPVLPPAEASAIGATDVVISSWINQQAIWKRRNIYEQQGLTVHRLYDGGAPA